MESGQSSQIVNAYMKNSMDLLVITGANLWKIKEFYKQLRFNVQSLDMLGSHTDVKGNVRCSLHKLKGIKADLVCGNEGWREWDAKNLLEQLKKWTEINSVEEINTEKLCTRSS